MVEKRAEDLSISQDMMADPSVNMLTINEGMKTQKLNEIKDKIEHQKNEEPVEVFVKDIKEAEAVTRAEAQYLHSIPENADEILDNVDEIVKEVKGGIQDKGAEWKEEAKDFAKDKVENLKETKDKVAESAKDIASRTSEKIEEFKDVASDKWSGASEKIHQFSDKASEKVGEYTEVIKKDLTKGLDVAKHQAQELSHQAQERYHRLREQNWTHSPYMYLFMGFFVAGASYAMYKMFM